MLNRCGVWRMDRRLSVAFLFLLVGCAVSTQEFRRNFDYQPIPATGRIDGTVELVASHRVTPEGVAVWKSYGNSQENIDNWQAAVADAIRTDMAQSGLFSAQAPGNNGPDLLLKVESVESTTPEPTLTITLSVLDPKTKAPVTRYERSANLGTSIFAYADNLKKGLATVLAGLREDLLADYQPGKLGTAAMTVRAQGAARQHLGAVQSAQARGDYAAALSAIRQALLADPQGIQPAVAAVELLQRLCDPESAKRLGEVALKAHPADADLQAAMNGNGVTPHESACQAQQLNREALVLARSGQRAEALMKLMEARRLAPGLVPKASYNAALLLEQAAKPQEAVAGYLEAYRGFLLPADQQESLQRLVAIAQRANVAAPETADRHYRLGIVRAQQKRFPEAATEFEAALNEAPWIVDAYYNLGLVYDFTNASRPALRALRTYLALAPQSPHASAVKTKIVELEDKLGPGE